MDVAAPDERAGPLWTAKLVRGDRHQVCAKRANVARNSARPLHRINVKNTACRMHDVGDFCDRLDNPGLVVGKHYGNQRPLGSRQCQAKRIQFNDPAGRHRKYFDLSGVEAPAAQHRRMLDRGNK